MTDEPDPPDEGDETAATGDPSGVPPWLIVTPTMGVEGDPIHIGGRKLATTSAVKFGAVDAEFTVVDDNNVEATVPNAIGTVSVILDRPGLPPVGAPFRYGSADE